MSRARATELAIPGRTVLDPVAPNPAPAALRMRYRLPRAQVVTLEIFDVVGKRVLALVDHAWQRSGYHALVWDGTTRRGPAPSGVYFCRLVAGEAVLARRIVRLE